MDTAKSEISQSFAKGHESGKGNRIIIYSLFFLILLNNSWHSWYIQILVFNET